MLVCLAAMVTLSSWYVFHVLSLFTFLTDHEPLTLSIYMAPTPSINMGPLATSSLSTRGPPHLPPAYNTVVECSQLTLAHFKFPHDAVTLMERNALSIQQCEQVHAALQLESQHWVPAFRYAGIPMDLALDLQDIFESVALLEGTGESSELECGSTSDLRNASADDSEVEAFIDLTLQD